MISLHNKTWRSREMTNRLLLGIAILGVVLAVCVSCQRKDQIPAGSDTPMVIGLASGEDPKQYVEGAAFLQSFLSQRLATNVKVFVTDGPEALVQAFRAGRIDAAFINPAGYIKANQSGLCWMGLVAVRSGLPYTEVCAFVRAESTIDGLSDLRGQTVAFTYPRATGGYFYPLRGFIDAGVVTDSVQKPFKRTIFIPRIDLGIRAVLDKQADVYFTYQNAPMDYFPSRTNELKVIWKSASIPNDGVAFSAKMPFGVVERLKAALCDVTSEQWLQVFPKGNIQRYEPTQDTAYRGVRAVCKDLSAVSFE
jgi:phosphonate transport system substrate-binding protein